MRTTTSRRDGANALFLLTLILIVSAQSFLHAQGLGYNKNRIAVTADGNSEPDTSNYNKWSLGDTDDIGATATALAILAKSKLQGELVHYSYNNMIGSPPGPDDRNKMKISAEGAIKRWDFDRSKFFDVTQQLDAARASLAAEISKSTKTDPLYLCLFGQSEFVYQAVELAMDQGNAGALSNVFVISHSRFNENQLRRPYHHTFPQVLSLSGDRIQYKKIKDQNSCDDPNEGLCSHKNYTPYEWMRAHEDETIRWIYTIIKDLEGKADVSDAGLVFYLLTGDENGNPAKLKKFIGNGIDLDASHSADEGEAP